MLTCLQLFPRNSLTAKAFIPYVSGENQYPHNNHCCILSESQKDSFIRKGHFYHQNSNQVTEKKWWLYNCMNDSPRDKINPPRTKRTSKAADPNVFATTGLLPTAANNRNRPFALWLMHSSKMNCLKNLLLQNFINFITNDFEPKLKCNVCHVLLFTFQCSDHNL